MKKKDAAGNEMSYVQKVSQDTGRYVRELLADNERVRSVAAGLEAELAALRRELDEARLTVARRIEDEAQLRRRLACVEDEGSRLSERYLEVEEQNANLANLYVASYRLHGTLDRNDVLEAIQEIVANLVGSEQLAIYSTSVDGSALERVASTGLIPIPPAVIPLGHGLIGTAAKEGETRLFPPGDGLSRLRHENDLRACVILKLDGVVTGVLAIFRLLPQKSAFGSLDRELFDLLATHAATALFCTSPGTTPAARSVARG
jgi:hypothetical protein